MLIKNTEITIIREKKEILVKVLACDYITIKAVEGHATKSIYKDKQVMAYWKSLKPKKIFNHGYKRSYTSAIENHCFYEILYTCK
jgi:hypothetical protein